MPEEAIKRLAIECKGKSAPAKRGPKPAIDSAKQAEMIDGYLSAKAAGITRKEYATRNGLKLDALARALNNNSQARRRGKRL